MKYPAWIAALLTRRMLICVFTGFSSGLPLYLLLNLLPADRFALELDLATLQTCAQRCQDLRTRGFRIVLDLSDVAVTDLDLLGDVASLCAAIEALAEGR